MYEIGQRAERLVDVGESIGDTHLVDVDPVGVKPTQRALDRFGDPPARRTLMGGIPVERNTELDGEYHAVASPAGQCLTHDLF